MRVLCRHGHISFYPMKANELARWQNFFGETLVRREEFFTFEPLADLPRYSLAGKPFALVPATKTYEGRNAWEVMRENNLVYNIETGLVVPKTAIVGVVSLPVSDTYWLGSSPLIQPGLRDGTAQQILSYDAFFDQDTLQLKVIEVSYE